MSQPKQKPIEKPPKGLRVPAFWHAKQHYGIPYRPGDKPKQEDWGTVAFKFGVDVQELIFFNFLTTDSAEVNWHLKNEVGCTKISPKGFNYMFSNGCYPGIIYIPPADDIKINYKPEEICVWKPDQIDKFLKSLRVIAQSIGGNRGERIQKLVGVILRVGHPACLDLWYYNVMNVTAYCDIKAHSPQLRDMTKATGGAFPFDGASGLFGQLGTFENHRGMWRIHAVKDLFDTYTCGSWDADDVKSSLEDIEDQMSRGWYQMQLVAAKAGMGGGTVYDQLVYEFLDHVTNLTKDDNHLYSAFRS